MTRKIKILIISGHFYPEQNPRSFRTTELAKELARQGHSLTVMAPNTNSASLELAEKYDIEIIRLDYHWKIIGNNRNKVIYILNRLLQHLFEYPKIQLLFLIKNKLKTLSNYDLLISIAQPFPVHWGVAALWKKNRQYNPAKVWIADCGDPYLNVKYAQLSKPFYMRWLENNFLEKADYITVPFSEMKDLFNAKYRKKYRVIPQGFKLDRSEDLPTYKKNDVSTFIYSGTIIPGKRDPFDLIEYLDKLGHDFRFIIYTKQKHQLIKFESLIGSKLLIRDYIPREELLIELAKADFLVNVNVKEVDGKVIAVPTKLIDYHISGRPILSYTQEELPISIVHEFLAGKYDGAFIDDEFQRYDIGKVAKSFIELADE